MMEQAISSIMFLAFFIALILFMIYDLTEVNVLKIIWKFTKRVSTPKSGIDKEIAEEEKEIAELERQKEKMDKLEEMKRRKERLFKDVHGEELWECTSCGDEFKTLQDYGRHISEAHHS